MQQSNQPPKYVIPFAQNDASKATIPPTSADDTRASQSQGFPPRTGLPPEAGGVPPQKADMNGVLNQLAGPILWSLAGGRFPFDNAFATDANIGGYPLGSNLPAADGRGEWYSTSNDNTSNPDTVGTGWVPGYHYGATALSGQTGGNVILTPAQAAKRVITVAGTLTSNLVLVVPAWVYSWTVYNNTSGAFSVSVRTASGSAAAIPQNGAPTPVNCDGTNCSLLSPNIGPATSGTQAARLDQMGGRLLNAQVFTSSGTYTPTPGAKFAIVEVLGGGGAGGSCPAVPANQQSTAGGGQSGAFVRALVASVATTAVTVGTGGAPAPAGSNAGGAGGASSFGALAVAPGGAGGGAGTASAASAGLFAPTRGSNPSVGPGATLLGGAAGTSGAGAIILSLTIVSSGVGGSSIYGAGGPSITTSTVGAPGVAGSGYGSGGSGAAQLATNSGDSGGAGTSGLVVVYEYA